MQSCSSRIQKTCSSIQLRYPSKCKARNSSSQLLFALDIISENLSSLELGVSKNSGTPKSSILIGFSIINHPFLGTPIFGNTQFPFLGDSTNSSTSFNSTELPRCVFPTPGGPATCRGGKPWKILGSHTWLVGAEIRLFQTTWDTYIYIYLYIYIYIWGFPKMVVPNNHGFSY